MMFVAEAPPMRRLTPALACVDTTSRPAGLCRGTCDTRRRSKGIELQVSADIDGLIRHQVAQPMQEGFEFVRALLAGQRYGRFGNREDSQRHPQCACPVRSRRHRFFRGRCVVDTRDNPLRRKRFRPCCLEVILAVGGRPTTTSGRRCFCMTARRCHSPNRPATNLIIRRRSLWRVGQCGTKV